MTTRGVIARAVGTTGASTPAYRVEIQAGRHPLTADEPESAGGGGIGPAPFELLLAGLVACTATTLRMDAEHHGWELAFVEVAVRYTRAADGTAAIERRITIPAEVTSEHLDRLVDVADRTPVTLAVQRGTPITTTFTARDPSP